MEFKIYQEKQDFLSDKKAILDVAATEYLQNYEKLNTKNYAFKFTDGEDFLLVLKVEPYNMLIHGSEKLAAFAAGVIADYHLEVGVAKGEAKPLKAFFEAYQKRLGGTFSKINNLDEQYCQINYLPGNIKQALFAGGCFWCMAKPYYEYEGIIKVFSGFAGGDKVNPTYEDVKAGTTHHKETVMLEYNSDIITYKELLDIYFDTIDPFDESGQFIDRGDNYTCAIFTDDPHERKIIEGFIKDIESEFNRKVQVKVLNNHIFYKAEEHHQDYAIKNPEAMKEELINSGRLKK